MQRGRKPEDEKIPPTVQRERKLPLTAEVGAEGGSYADRTLQVPTFNEDLPETPERVVEPPPAPDPEPVPRLRRDPTE